MRKKINLNAGWTFSKNGEDWTEVQLPHTWNNLDGQDGGNDYEKGKFCYRKSFFLTDDMEGKSVYLEFEGANSRCEVWLNGNFLGKHKGGYSRFRFPVTKMLCADKMNRLEVWVDNRIGEDVYPIDADFTFFGGIYRDVHLVIVSKVHFDLMDDGSMGIYVTPVLECMTYAKILVCVRIDAERPVGSLSVRYSLKDTAGMTVYSKESICCEEELYIQNPVLWNGKEQPYLYSVKVVLQENGNPVDELEIPFGIRSFTVDADRGFF